MSYPDWIEDRFGDDIPDWAEDRWGEDDYDDYDDDYNQEKENNNMEYKKIFFNNLQTKISYDKDIIECILNNDELIAMHRTDSKYIIFVQPDIVKLANVFGFNLEERIEASIIEASKIVNNFKQIISKSLLEEINKYCFLKDNFVKYQTSFLSPFQDDISFTLMINSLMTIYNIKTFNDLRNKCKELAIDLNIEDIEKKLNYLIIKKNESSSYERDKLNKLIMNEYELINNLKNSYLFKKEIFALIYINLEKYVLKESSYNDIYNVINNNEYKTITKNIN